ncbi:hypothetical protein L7F22_034467 [Adiantum nelumboides]|nr:hypothetical protein [Adiantum nelumboides]
MSRASRAEEARWDVKDVQAHALIALSVKHTIIPHIRSAKSAKEAWDILAGLYAGRNEAKIALLRKELESKIMNEKDDMDTFLASIKDINEQLISAGEIISDSSLVQTVLDALSDSYQTFTSTWRLMNQRNPEVVKFDEVCTLLLQEALSRKNRFRQRAVEQVCTLLLQEALSKKTALPWLGLVAAPAPSPLICWPPYVPSFQRQSAVSKAFPFVIPLVVHVKCSKQRFWRSKLLLQLALDFVARLLKCSSQCCMRYSPSGIMILHISAALASFVPFSSAHGIGLPYE